jgi:hypothetical protein
MVFTNQLYVEAGEFLRNSRWTHSRSSIAFTFSRTRRYSLAWSISALVQSFQTFFITCSSVQTFSSTCVVNMIETQDVVHYVACLQLACTSCTCTCSRQKVCCGVCSTLCMITYLSCQEEAGHSDHTAVVLRKALHCKEAMEKHQSSLCCVWWPVSGSDDKEEGFSIIDV